MTCNSCVCTSVSTHIHIRIQTQNQCNHQKPDPIPQILSRAFCSVMVRPFVLVDQIQQPNEITFLLFVSLNVAFKVLSISLYCPRKNCRVPSCHHASGVLLHYSLQLITGYIKKSIVSKKQQPTILLILN